LTERYIAATRAVVDIIASAAAESPQVYGDLAKKLNEENCDVAAIYGAFLARRRQKTGISPSSDVVELFIDDINLLSILRPVAAQFCIPLTVGRGFSSLPPRNNMARRFRRSGKQQLILLIVSDFDPDGEEIARSFAPSMRDDLDVRRIHAIKVALAKDQVSQYNLPPNMLAKEDPHA
jgi:hypothetical protein